LCSVGYEPDGRLLIFGKNRIGLKSENMRVLVVFLLCALTTVAYSNVDPDPGLISQVVVASRLEPEAQSIWPFGKKRKKKMKGSNRLKKQNRRMGKKFRRQNDDSIRRD